MRALVTRASRGIGEATARRLAEDNAEVAIHYHRHRTEAEELLNDIERRGGHGFLVSGDLGVPSEVNDLVRQVKSQWNQLDVLVHNAGSYPRAKFRDLTPQELRAAFEVHVFGPAKLTQGLLPLLDESEAGRVIFVSSVLAFTGSRHGAPYAAAKAAILGLARSLAKELAPGITVNVVAPGSIDTAVLQNDTKAQRAERNHTIPLGRIGEPAEVAEAIAFLASPRSSYLTGMTLHVNGGLRSD